MVPTSFIIGIKVILKVSWSTAAIGQQTKSVTQVISIPKSIIRVVVKTPIFSSSMPLDCRITEQTSCNDDKPNTLKIN